MKEKLSKVVLCLVLMVFVVSFVANEGVSAAQAFIEPTKIGTYDGKITSHYGMRNGTLHAGIDIANSASNVSVNASAGGVVTHAVGGCSNEGGYENTCNNYRGNYIIIRHSIGGSTFDTLYEHLAPSSFIVSVGQTVAQGQRIATMGNSGSSTGQHLHFEIHPGGFVDKSSAEDPYPYITGQINPAPVYHDFDGTYASLRTKSVTGGNTVTFYAHPGYGIIGTKPVGSQYKVYSVALGSDGYKYYAIGGGYIHENNATISNYKGTVKSGKTVYVYDAPGGTAKKVISAGTNYNLIAARTDSSGNGWYAIDSTNWFKAEDLNVTK